MNLTFYEPDLGDKKYLIEYRASGESVIPGCFRVSNEQGHRIELSEKEMFSIIHQGLTTLLGTKNSLICRIKD